MVSIYIINIMVMCFSIQGNSYDKYIDIMQREQNSVKEFTAELQIKQIYNESVQNSELSLPVNFTMKVFWVDFNEFSISILSNGVEIRKIQANTEIIDTGISKFYSIRFLETPIFALSSMEAEQYKEEMWPYYLVRNHFFPLTEDNSLIGETYFNEHYTIEERNTQIVFYDKRPDPKFLREYKIFNCTGEALFAKGFGVFQSYSGSIFQINDYRVLSLCFLDFSNVTVSRKKVLSEIRNLSDNIENKKDIIINCESEKIIQWDKKYYKKNEETLWNKVRTFFIWTH